MSAPEYSPVRGTSGPLALVDAALLRPLPFGEPDRLVAIHETSSEGDRSSVSPLNMMDWNQRSRAFERIAAFVPGVGGMVMAGADGNVENVPRQWVSAEIFDVMAVKPILGRTFLRADEEQRARCGHERSFLALSIQLGSDRRGPRDSTRRFDVECGWDRA